MSDNIQTIQVRDITEFLKYAMYSDYVFIDYEKHEMPINPVIVAPAGAGKTAIVDQYSDNDGILVLSKVTEWSLLKNYLDDMKTGKIKRILIPDFVNPANMKAETVNSLITFLNLYISWEGVRTVSTYAGHYPIAIKNPLRGSLMATMATNDFERMANALAATGFLSRLIIIGYFYSRDAVKQIMLDIVNNEFTWNRLHLKFPENRMQIQACSKYTDRLIPYALDLGRKVQGYDIRALQQMMLMCKARALSEGRDSVNGDDVDKVIYLFSTYVLKVPRYDMDIKEQMNKEFVPLNKR